MDFAPAWIVDEAFQKVHKENSINAYRSVTEDEVPCNANFITSHVVYKLETVEDRTRKLKARIVLHRNRDIEKNSVRKDSSSAQLNVVRPLLS